MKLSFFYFFAINISFYLFKILSANYNCYKKIFFFLIIKHFQNNNLLKIK